MALVIRSMPPQPLTAERIYSRGTGRKNLTNARRARQSIRPSARAETERTRIQPLGLDRLARWPLLRQLIGWKLFSICRIDGVASALVRAYHLLAHPGAQAAPAFPKTARDGYLYSRCTQAAGSRPLAEALEGFRLLSEASPLFAVGGLASSRVDHEREEQSEAICP